MRSFNLSEWAIEHRSLVWFLMIVAALAGLMAYGKLGREEDPAFTIKTMVIQQQWPGATVEETINQITDPIEKELQQLDSLDYTRSYTTPGQTTIFVTLKDTTRDAPWQFYQVRKHVQDIQYQLPSGVRPPGFNDEFGDVFGNIYAFTADGLTLPPASRLRRASPDWHQQCPKSRQGSGHRRPERDDLSRFLGAEARGAWT